MHALRPNIKPIEYTDKSYLISENIVPMYKPDTNAGTGQIPDIGGAPEPEGDVTVHPKGAAWLVIGVLLLIALVGFCFRGGGRPFHLLFPIHF